MQVFHEQQRIKRVAITLSDEAAERRQRLVEKSRCLVCEEPIQGPSRRGLCAACYQFQQRLIQSGERTEVSLIEEGMRIERPVKPHVNRKGMKKSRAKREALRVVE